MRPVKTTTSMEVDLKGRKPHRTHPQTKMITKMTTEEEMRDKHRGENSHRKQIQGRHFMFEVEIKT